MGRPRLAAVAWKVLLYLVVTVVLAGVTRDLVLTAVLALGFVAGDTSLATLLRADSARRPDPRDADVS